MKKDLVEMVFILDRSGSMKGLEADSIGGFNALIEKQKKLPGEALVSLVLFDHEFKVIHHRKQIQSIPLLTLADFEVRGSTALVDAIGRSIRKIRSIHDAMGEDSTPEKTMFIITTDGQENASREFNTYQLKRMVEEHQEKDKWEFLFLGANMDAFAVAHDLGFKKERTANYQANREGVGASFAAAERAVNYMRLKPRNLWKVEENNLSTLVDEETKKQK
jgi:uncharacterized protein YegL